MTGTSDENSSNPGKNPPYQLSDAFLEGEPIPLTSFALHDRSQRQAFLGEFCKIGEPALFEAVSHIWSSLSAPREARCIAIGQSAGTGGAGKSALDKLLRACLDEMVVWGNPLPKPEDYASIDKWHEAAMATFAAEAAREESVLAQYATILNGDDPGFVNPGDAKIVIGPWPGLQSTKT